MEKGKFYKREAEDLIVLCLEKENIDNEFCGIVVHSGSGEHMVGYKSNWWNIFEFEPFEPILKIVNGGTYDIPEGCIATVKDNKLTIESEVRYYYEVLSNCTAYIKEDGDSSIVIRVYFDNKNTNSISFEKGIKNKFNKKPLHSDKFFEILDQVCLYQNKELSCFYETQMSI